MALRVLLADESVTIKKVFQLALKDFAVEVTSVNVGLDVVAVAKKFKPDIVFADVLLQKKNGYEVCADLRKDPSMAATPVVLIWSGFMELDQAKFMACGATADLEKPFDTEKLRGLVKTLVTKTANNPISDYLSFPDMPEWQDERPASPRMTPVSQSTTPPLPELTVVGGSAPEPSPEEDWSMESFAPLKAPPPEPTLAPPLPTEAEDEEAEWVAKTLTQYKMDKKQLLKEPEVHFEVPEEKIDPDTLIRNEQSVVAAQPQEAPDELDEIELELPPRLVETPNHGSGLSEKQMEAIFRAEAREMIEKVVWEIVPEIATQILEREIRKILKENDESPS